MEKRFDLLASGMTYDLRLISVTDKEWRQWQDELLKLATSVINEMCRYHSSFSLTKRPEIFQESARVGDQMVFRFHSEAGKVQVYFDCCPKTLQISYARMEPTLYEEVFSLF
ncbi:hypothetical protein [Rossellomorea marisflavi]|uniref:hypothetical protein n=1 Tax=Rossellomorea marisflavi TaxID=189381 RepID=UPI003FA0F8E4